MITMPMTLKEDENEARIILNEYALFNKSLKQAKIIILIFFWLKVFELVFFYQPH